MSNKIYQYSIVITLLIMFISVIYTRDFWTNSYNSVKIGEATRKLNFQKVSIDTLIQVGEENRFLVTGDIFDKSYTFFGYSNSINNGITPIIINDTIFHTPLIAKGKLIDVRYSENYAFAVNENYRPQTLNKIFLMSPLGKQFAIILCLICVPVFLFFYLNIENNTLITLFFTLIKYITASAAVFSLIIFFVMVFSWIGCFQNGEKYNLVSEYEKYNILIDRFNTGRIYHTTWKKGADGARTFMGYGGDAYASDLNNFKTPIDVNEIMLLTDTLKKPVPAYYTIWYNKKTQNAFIANYMEINSIPSLGMKLYNHLFSEIMIIFYIGIFVCFTGHTILKLYKPKILIQTKSQPLVEDVN